MLVATAKHAFVSLRICIAPLMECSKHLFRRLYTGLCLNGIVGCILISTSISEIRQKIGMSVNVAILSTAAAPV